MTDGSAGASGGFTATVAGRIVTVKIGQKTQTVNVRAADGSTGRYDMKLRLEGGPALTRGELEQFESLAELHAWLTGLNAKDETDAAKSLLPPIIEAHGVEDGWLEEATAVVENEIDGLVRDFLVEPYLHRVEHSLHAEVFLRLKQHRIFADEYAIAATGRKTQLVHKEWPETSAQDSSRRGSYDLAVIAPSQLAAAAQQPATLDHIRFGRIEAPIVIEMALNYGWEHLEQDHTKLRVNQVRRGYLVHLQRDTAVDPRVEAFLRSPDREQDAAGANSCKVAFAHRSRRGTTSFKTLNESLTP